MDNNSENILEQISQMFSNKEDVPNGIKDLFNNLNSTSNENGKTDKKETEKTSNDSSGIDIDMLMKASRIASSLNSNTNDPRKSLLLSLKPYLKDEKKDKIDQYIKFLSLSKVIEEFGPEFFGSSGNHDK